MVTLQKQNKCKLLWCAGQVSQWILMKRKSQPFSFLLTFMLGPLGLFYSSGWAGLVASVVLIPLSFFYLLGSVSRSMNPVVGGLGEYDIWHLGMCLACSAAGYAIVNRNNAEIQRLEDREDSKHRELIRTLSSHSSE